jgi:hypothetical protein
MNLSSNEHIPARITLFKLSFVNLCALESLCQKKKPQKAQIHIITQSRKFAIEIMLTGNILFKDPS